MTSVPAAMNPARSFQGLLLTLQRYWAEHGCVILQPYDMEVGAGTFHPATTLRALGPKPWKAAYVQPSRRPKDGRYGENPNRLQHYYQFQVILKPNPPNLQELYLDSLKAIGIDLALHDVRFVEDDWESPTLGAWGLGWECWCDGMEVSQFTYFQQVAGFECAPVSGELTYGLERLAMYVQGVENVYDLNFNGLEGEDEGHLRRRLPAGRAGIFAAQFRARRHRDAVPAVPRRRGGVPNTSLPASRSRGANEKRHQMALPAYDQCIKASHVFNLLDARGVISVTERQSYILRVRELAKACGAAWLKTEAAGLAARLASRSRGEGPPDLVTRGRSCASGSTPLNASLRAGEGEGAVTKESPRCGKAPSVTAPWPPTSLRSARWLSRTSLSPKAREVSNHAPYGSRMERRPQRPMASPPRGRRALPDLLLELFPKRSPPACSARRRI